MLGKNLPFGHCRELCLFPTPATVKEDFLGGVHAPGIDTFKDFLRFYIASSKGGLLDDRPTVDSIIVRRLRSLLG
jgi:hypothetical protein